MKTPRERPKTAARRDTDAGREDDFEDRRRDHVRGLRLGFWSSCPRVSGCSLVKSGLFGVAAMACWWRSFFGGIKRVFSGNYIFCPRAAAAP